MIKMSFVLSHVLSEFPTTVTKISESDATFSDDDEQSDNNDTILSENDNTNNHTSICSLKVRAQDSTKVQNIDR